MTPTEIGSSSTQSYGHDDRARAEPAELARPVERERHDRVVDGDRGDRELVRLRVRDPDPDLARRELDAADVELVGRRRVAARPGRRASEPLARTRRRRARAGASGAERPEAPAQPARVAASARAPPSVDHVEEAHPAELGELRLVRVEHEQAGVRELDLDHAALALALHHRVRVLPVLARAVRLVAEEVGVEVERVDQVELGQVREVDPDELRAADRDRVAARSRSCGR